MAQANCLINSIRALLTGAIPKQPTSPWRAERTGRQFAGCSRRPSLGRFKSVGQDGGAARWTKLLSALSEYLTAVYDGDLIDNCGPNFWSLP
jgi:hypothetical protein